MVFVLHQSAPVLLVLQVQSGFFLVIMSKIHYTPHLNLSCPVPFVFRLECAVMEKRWVVIREIAAHLGVNTDIIYKRVNRKKQTAYERGSLRKTLASE
jgi:hypothetical protein